MLTSGTPAVRLAPPFAAEGAGPAASAEAPRRSAWWAPRESLDTFAAAAPRAAPGDPRALFAVQLGTDYPLPPARMVVLAAYHATDAERIRIEGPVRPVDRWV